MKFHWLKDSTTTTVETLFGQSVGATPGDHVAEVRKSLQVDDVVSGRKTVDEHLKHTSQTMNTTNGTY